MYKSIKEGRDLLELISDIVTHDKRIDIFVFKLTTSLDHLFKIMDKNEMKSSSMIKSLVKKKKILFQIIPYNSNFDILEWLHSNFDELNDILMPKKSSFFDIYNKSPLLNSIESTNDELTKIETLTDIGDDPEVIRLIRRERDFLLSKAYIPLNEQNDLESVMIEDIFYFKHKLNVAIATVSFVKPSAMTDSPFLQIKKDEMKSIVGQLDKELPSNTGSDYDFHTASMEYHDADEEGEDFDTIEPVDDDEATPCCRDVVDRLQAVFPLSVGEENAQKLITFAQNKSEYLSKLNCLFPDSAHNGYNEKEFTEENIKKIPFNDIEVVENNDVDQRMTLDLTKPSINVSMKNALQNFVFKPFHDFNMSTCPNSENLSSISRDVSVEDLLPEDFIKFGYRAGVYILSQDCITVLKTFIKDKIEDIMSTAKINAGIKFDDPKLVPIESNLKDQLKHSEKEIILSKDVERALRYTTKYLPKVVLGFGIRGIRYIFSDWIVRVLKQVHPSIMISVKALTLMNDSLTWMLVTMLEDFNEVSLRRTIEKLDDDTRCWITVQDVVHCIKQRYVGELSKHGVSESIKCTKKLTSHADYEFYDIDESGEIVLKKFEEKKITSLTTMSSLQFEVRPIAYVIKQLYPHMKLSLGTLAAISAALEYLSAELLELAGNQCRDRRSKLISNRDLYLAIVKDQELHDTFNCCIFSDSGTSFKIIDVDEILDDDFDTNTSTFDILFSSVQSDTKMFMIDPRDGILKDIKSEESYESVNLFRASSTMPLLYEKLSSHSRDRLKFIAINNLTTDLKSTIESFSEFNIYSHFKRIQKDIMREQERTDYCISFATWRSLINKYKGNDQCMTEESYRMIALAIENEIIGLLADAAIVARENKRMIVTRNDIKLSKKRIY